MLRKPEACRSCPFYQTGFGFIPTEGKDELGVTLVGEAGGANEAKQGKPFMRFAQAGSKLEEAIRLLRHRREEFKIGNIISCQPNNFLEGSPHELVAINHCKPNRPKGHVYIALGKIPMKYLTGVSGDGKETVSMLRGYALPTPEGNNDIVIPTFHPSYIKRGKPQFIQYLLWDIQKGLNYAKNDATRPNYDFIENPTWDIGKSFYYRVRDNERLSLAFDIETESTFDSEEDERQGIAHSTITQIQFSLEKDRAIAFPWNETWFNIIRLLLLTKNLKLGFNSYNFDAPRLENQGMEIAGVHIDVMWMWKHWNPGLERGLQKVASCFDYPEPWKHLASVNQAKYGCHDVNALQYIFEPLKEKMEKDGVWS